MLSWCVVWQEDHQTSIEKITAAITASLQQMPLVNGAICGTAAVSSAQKLQLRTTS